MRYRSRPELAELAARYAFYADRRDAEGFVAVFAPDGILRTASRPGSGPPRTALQGTAELATVTEALRRYDRTMHIVGTSVYSDGEETAVGTVYCVAHHLEGEGDTRTDRVMYIRYEDSYRCVGGQEWAIAEREVHLEWTERRTVQTRYGRPG